jgi:small subunit ribosomal protein S2
MSSLVTELVESGIHFGQRRSNWNPRMRPYIYATRNGIHIIDIKETIKGLLLAKKFVAKTVADGKDVLFVGTKRQAQAALEQYVGGVKMPYVTERWLGGTLTNFRTIRERLKRLEELERIMESGEIKNYSKKMESQLTREQKKIFRNLNGIRTMHKLPGAVMVIDTNREKNALLEAKNLGIPTICLIDTDGDPELADIPIPGNDDSMRSIDVIVRELCAAAAEGLGHRHNAEQTAAKGGSGGHGGEAGEGGEGRGEEGGQRRRSSRARFRADGTTDEAGSQIAATTE